MLHIDDLRMVGAIFGKKALEDPEPAGLKRMTIEDQPEVYPATTERWAELLPVDQGMVATLRPL